jgi:hypothetical protein
MKEGKMGKAIVRTLVAERERLIEEAASIVEPHDFAEVEAFAAKLTGLGGLSHQEMLAECAGIEVPRDFRHLRLTNLNRNLLWGGRVSCSHAPLTLKDVLLHIGTVMNDREATEHGRGFWARTVALPVVNPGVLELGLIFEAMN